MATVVAGMKKHHNTASSTYRQLTMRFIGRISHASRQEQWGRTFINLAWTAGPVTFLALQGGYFFGFGHRPPEHLFYYFGGYTLVAGVVSIITRFVYNITRGKSLQHAEQALHSVMSGLPDLIAACRDATIAFYEPQYRPTITARYILANPDASSDAIGLAVHMLTGDASLAAAARTSETLRRQGLPTLCRETADSVHKALQKACTQVSEVSPELARMLYDRMHGRVNSKRKGLPRTNGFLFRGLKAIEKNDPSHMNLTDTIEIATLSFELLAGREFPRIELRYKGARYISEAGQRLERARRALRSAVHRRNSRLWSVGEHLRNRRSMKRFAAVVNAIHRPKTWMEEIDAAVQELVKVMGSQPSPQEQQFARRAMQKLKDLEKAEVQLRRVERELVRARLGYNAARNRLESKRGRSAAPVILYSGQRLKLRDRVGIELEKSGIALEKKQQRELAIKLATIINDLEKAIGDPGRLVQLGFRIMQVVEESLPIYRWTIQSALERSNAPDLAQLEQGLTSSTKIGWALSLVRELQPNYAEIVHAIARALVDYHRIELDEDTIEYLVEEYGASQVYLQALTPSDEEDIVMPEKTVDWSLKHATQKLAAVLKSPEKKTAVRRLSRKPV